MNQPDVETLHLRPSQKVGVISVFTALAIATDYAMVPLPNVKLMDTIVFVCGFAFGLWTGVSVGALTWLVYGSVNPLGAAGGSLLLILIVSETVYAFFGCLARRIAGPRGSISSKSLVWGSLGLIATFLYDLNTILTPSMLTGMNLFHAALSMLPAIPFMLAHEISNFLFFSTVGPVLVAAIFKVSRFRTSSPAVGAAGGPSGPSAPSSAPRMSGQGATTSRSAELEASEPRG
jgi:hypothetical protein